MVQKRELGANGRLTDVALGEVTPEYCLRKRCVCGVGSEVYFVEKRQYCPVKHGISEDKKYWND
jgi:hypothetical protein